VRGVAFGYNDEAAGLLVEAMDDAGAQIAAGRRERLETEEQRVDKGIAIARVFGLPGSGMHHHAGRLVNDGKVLVFENDFERNILGSCSEWSGTGFARDHDFFAAAQFVRWLAQHAIDKDVSLLEKKLNTGTADTLQLRGDEVVETLASGVLGY